jgi:uncharacterized phage protein gp47/JayE
MWQRPTLAELIKRAINMLNSYLPGTDAALRRANTNALAKMHAGGVHGLHGHLAYIAQQVIYDTAEMEYLERWAAIWGITRKAAEYASGPVDFTGITGSVIPAGTELQDGNQNIYTLDADVTLAEGVCSGVVTASVAGVDGNADEDVTLTLVSAIEGVDTAASVGVGGITGGFDTESDDDLRGRFLARIRQAPHGGAEFDYEAWALEVAGVTRAWCYPQQQGLGTVGVTFVCDDQVDSIIPSAATVAAVQAHIDLVRPVTADVLVYAPTPVALDLTISLTPATVAVKAAVTAELEDLILREAIPGGTILVSHIREAISIAAGETDHALTSPAADVTHSAGEIAVLGTITWV